MRMPELRELLGGHIRQAREHLGWTQQQLAEKVGLNYSEQISQIELGKRDVKAWELHKIANALRVDFQELLSSDGPRFGPAPLWRQSRTGAPQNKAEMEALLRLRSLRYHQVLEMTYAAKGEELPWKDDLDVLNANYDQLYSLAEDVRQHLDLGEAPAKKLFDTLEERYGVMIFFADLGENGSAMSVRGPYGPAMLLNKQEPPWRRNYSCAHELFHLLTWNAVPRGQIENHDTFEKVERAAEAFASALLMPRQSVIAQVRQHLCNHQLAVSALIEIARWFDVSTTALFWRLVNLGIIPREARDRLDDPSFRQAARETMSSCWWTPEDLPKRFVERAVQACAQGLLSRARLASLFDCDLSALPGFLANYGLDLDLIDTVHEATIALA